MTKIVIPLTAFILPMKKQGKMRLVKMTLNNWIMIHGMRAGRMIANKRKHEIQAKIMPLVDQAMVDGLAPIGAKTKFKFDWYFPDRRTDLDNWTFTHKFIFDAFQASSARGQVFMPNDNLNFVVATCDNFMGVDKNNPRVEIDWDNQNKQPRVERLRAREQVGIKKINDYVLSEHAQDRLLERFKTTKSNWNAWLSNFNKNAELKRIEKHRGQEAEIWHSGEVGMVIEPATKNIVTVYHIYGKDFPESLKIDLRNTALRLQDKAEMAFKERTKALANQLAYRDVEANETEQVVSQMVQAKTEYNTYCDGLFALANSEEMEKQTVAKMKQLNEFAQSRGYRDWIEFKAYEEPETVREARKMIERGY